MSPANEVGGTKTDLDTQQETPSNRYSIPNATARIERQLILDALEACQGNKSKAAKCLEISERSLWNKLDLYQLR
jgi:two-component system, NtrC family, response regulator AtoC